ncbi:MAG: hypothetical protein JO076_02980 [Verrucomicrobia bacterium]|nr:hypothetical protein [Verrucomicrobiota bacterium]
MRFFLHAAFLLGIGIISVAYNPHTGALGFNPDAKSGLIVTAAFALISFFWGYLYRHKSRRLALTGGLITTLLLFLGTMPRAIGAWRGFSSGDPSHWFAATTISLVILGSIPLFVSIWLEMRHAIKTR